jgi:hypothetical protein
MNGNQTNFFTFGIKVIDGFAAASVTEPIAMMTRSASSAP